MEVEEAIEPTHVLLQRLINEGLKQSQNTPVIDAITHYPRIAAVHKLLFSACIETLPNDDNSNNYDPDNSVDSALNLLKVDISRLPGVLSYEIVLESNRKITFAEFLITRLLGASTRLGAIKIHDLSLSNARFDLRRKILDILSLTLYLLSVGIFDEDNTETDFDNLGLIQATIKRLISLISNLNISYSKNLVFPISIEIYDPQKTVDDISDDILSDGSIVLNSSLSFLSFTDSVNDVLSTLFNQLQSSFLFIDSIPKFITHLKSYCIQTANMNNSSGNDSDQISLEKLQFQSNFVKICRYMLTSATEHSLNCIIIILMNVINNNNEINDDNIVLNALNEAFEYISINNLSFSPSSYNISCKIAQDVSKLSLKYVKSDDGHDAFISFLSAFLGNIPPNEVTSIVPIDIINDLFVALNERRSKSTITQSQLKLFHKLKTITANRKRKRDVSGTLISSQSISSLTRNTSVYRDIDSSGGQDGLLYVLMNWWGFDYSHALKLTSDDVQNVNWANEALERSLQLVDTETLSEGIGLLAPAIAGTLLISKENLKKAPKCSFSDQSCPDLSSTSTVPSNATIEIAKHLIRFLNITTKSRLLFLISLRRMLVHSGLQAAKENWETSIIANFILQCLSDDDRNVRLAAGRAAHAIVISQEAAVQKQLISPKDLGHNKLFDKFDDILKQDDPKLYESSLISAALIGKSIPIERLYRCLLCLFKILSNVNPLLRSIAYIHLNYLAENHSTTMYKVCSSHLPQLSVFLVMNMLSSPHILTDAMSLLGFPDPKAFLHQTLRYTLPSLIAENRKDILQSISRMLGQFIQPLCLEYVEHILAHLYLRVGTERDKGIELFLEEFQGSKKKINLSSVIISCGPQLLASLVMAMGDEDSTIAQTAMDSIDSIEDTISNSNKSKVRNKNTRRYSNNEDTFLRNHILGIMSIISDNLNDVQGRRSLDEKRKIIRSLGVLIEKVGPGIISVSPQVMALLQGFLEVDTLRYVTLKSLYSFITTLTFKDIGPYIGRTSASFVGNWLIYSNKEKDIAKSILDYILDNAKDMQDQASEMLEMRHIPDLNDQQRKLNLLRRDWNFKQMLENILQRSSKENARVRLHSLIELKSFIMSNGKNLKNLTTGDNFDPIIGNVLKVILSAADRSGDLQLQIQNACFDCIGALGAIDPDRIDLPSDDKTMIIDHNFEDYDETVKFVMSLMTNELVGAYRSTSDSRAQQDLAYAIQELLKFCGFKPELLRRDNTSVPARVRQRWESFPRQVLETLSTLLTDGRYIARESKRRPIDHPIYPQCKSYGEWLRLWTTDLIWKTGGGQASAIFSVFKAVVRNQDVGVARYILPYLVLNVLITGEESDREQMSEEITVILSDQINNTSEEYHNKRLLSAQTIFDLMDHLGKWSRKQRINIQYLEKAFYRNRQRSMPQQKIQADTFKNNLDKVHPLISSVDPDLIAHAALQCRSYARSLLTFEQRIYQLRSEGNEMELQPYYEHLHKIYSSLDEPDGMEGISTNIISPSLEHQIREHESTGRWTAAQSCWEVELQKRPDDLNLHTGLLRCLRSLGHYDTLRTHIIGVLSNHPEWREQLGSFHTEGAWIVGDWKTVRENVSMGVAKYSPEYSLARILLAMHDGELSQLPVLLHDARQQLGMPIIAAGRDGYRRAYDSSIHLHMVHELEIISRAITHISHLVNSNSNVAATEAAAKLTSSLEGRLEVTMPTFKSREPLLSLRRSAIGTASANQRWSQFEVGTLWLSSAKTARKAGHFQTAYSASLQADQLETPFSFIQSAKLIRANGENERALRELDAGIKYKIPNIMNEILAQGDKNNTIDLTFEEDPPHDDYRIKYKTLTAKCYLLKARWCTEGDRFNFNEMERFFRDAIEEMKDREHPHYELGHFYDEYMKRTTKEKNKQWYYNNTCRCYYKTIQYGTKYIYHAMPRLLTLWLDYGAKPEIIKREEAKRQIMFDTNDILWVAYNKVNGLMFKGTEVFPPYTWYIAFAQIVSRIGHQNKKVYRILEQIIIAVLKEYPHQALWAMVGMINSTKQRRAERCKQIIQKVQNQEGQSNYKIIREALTLTDELLALCNRRVASDETFLSIKKSFPKLDSLKSMNFMLPLQSSMTVTLPSTNRYSNTHQPFPEKPVKIAKFDDVIELMKSLVKPRKLTIIGDNGQAYSFLCKPDDDLRKDARLMDFNSMINKLLKSNSEARKRSLYIRTYTVIPLNERCGLIEWVKDTKTFRSILVERYDLRNIRWFVPENQLCLEKCRQNVDEAHNIFNKKLLSRYPKVFHEWFIEMFPEPSEWLKARMTYSRTLAVMSMTGFILGLGDRHCENILLDKNDGAIQHVDFNCLFEKGTQFDIPERVPFRLTQNLIDGMGINGTEGVFRKAAEITMEVLRSNKDSLMSVVESFLHDPLVDWEDERRRQENRYRTQPRSFRSNSSVGDEDPEGQKIINELAMNALKPIAKKLEGLQITFDGPIDKQTSVTGQVDSLIREAASPFNLSQMYVGWAPWL